MQLLQCVIVLLISLLISLSQCSHCTHGSVRVSFLQYGAVDVCLNDTWGSICSDFWDNSDASVICRQLGYSPYGAIGPSAVHTTSLTPAHNIIDLNCTGEESTILECPFNGFTGHSCSLNRDANVYCHDVNLVTFSNCTEGEVRLIGGSSEYEGRVEVCSNKAWGTVCSNYWSSGDAKVVCNQRGALSLGFSYGSITGLGFPQGQGLILLGYLYCSGWETNLLDCSQNYYLTSTIASCKQHRYDAAVRCEPHCVNGTVRLRGGSSTYGRVEVCVNESWSTICSDYWVYEDAAVICNQLGYSPYGAISASGYYTDYVWPFGIINPNCTGIENSVFNCSYDQSGLCVASHDASVICQSNTIQPVNCETGDVRLVGGTLESEGRLEVCVNQVWGTVCSPRWSSGDTRVVCRQLGHQKLGGLSYSSSTYGRGNGPIIFGYMYCTGSEESLFLCNRGVFTVATGQCASHYYDIGLKCEVVCEHGKMRLQQGSTAATGRVEVCLNGTWGTVCSDFWDNSDASVVCSQLGYSPYGAIAVSGYYLDYVWPHHINDLNCSGNETSFLDCSYNGLIDYTCLNSHDASISCQDINTPRSDCVDGEIKLEGGSTQYEGRVEICINKAWGTVCSGYYYSWRRRYHWGSSDSNVVCRQLGHMELGSVAYRTASKYGQGTGPIFMSRVQCTGQESHLLSCPYRPIPYSTCSHSYDVGIKCEAPCENGTVRLYSESGSYFRRYGRVQVCINNVWGTICDHFWDENDASVVCRMLGYSSYGASAVTNVYTEGVWYIHIRDLNCTGNESSLWDCPMNGLSGYSCNHYDDAAVICQLFGVVNSGCITNDLRLTDGSSQYEGRVEVCVNGVWGSVCDGRWNNLNAHTVCRQLGYQGGKAVYNSHFGIRTMPLHIYSLSCSYYSPNLTSCSQSKFPVYSTPCNNYQEAGVMCEAPCTNGSVGVYSSSLNNVGNVRVCVNSTWSKVCGTGDTLLDDNLASVTCYSAGFSLYGAKSYKNVWTDHSYPYKILNIKCRGDESHLFECMYDTEGSCSSNNALAVTCQKSSVVRSDNCTENDIRLYGGTEDNEGTLYICNNGVWGIVCRNYYRYYHWRSLNTNVVCRQLGYTIYGNTNTYILSDETHPTVYTEFSCLHYNTKLSSCSSRLHSSVQSCFQAIKITCRKLCTTNGDIRLVGGYYYGRVEVCIGGVWGSICRDSLWDNADASVICRQLGFSPYGAIAVHTNWFSDFSIPTFLTGLDCTGSEKYVTHCPFRTVPSVCSPSADANVICPVHGSTYANCSDGDIKLVGGTTEYEGRVEICINSAWGTIARSSSNIAQTICNKLGYTIAGAITVYNAYFGEGTGPVLLTNVYCSSPRESLLDCSITHYSNYVNHNYDIGVRCEPPCHHGDIRLAASSNPLTGRVEICVNSTWGTVCNDYWDDSDASVVCRQVGFSGEGININIKEIETASIGAIAQTRYYYYLSNFPVHITDLNCNGTEESVLDCSHNTITQHSCQRYSTAYVQCPVPDRTDNCTNGDIRLIDGQSEYEGLVEICFDGSWGYICNRRWGNAEAKVTCKQLGHTPIGATISSSFGQGAGPVHFTNFFCSGSESDLLSCLHYTGKCTSHSAVKCEAPCSNGEVRLKGNRRYSSFGRVEVCMEGTWGTICDDYWDDTDASVLCRQLGFSPYGAISKTSFYTEGILPHTVFNMSCSGSEVDILECAYSITVPSGSQCYKHEDASVICQDSSVVHSNCTDYDVRLVGGAVANEGKVLMCLNGVWGAICDKYISDVDAGLICFHAGYSRVGSVYRAKFANSSNDILLVTDISCSQSDTSIDECSISHYTTPSSCDVQNIVAVRCLNCTDGDIKIIPYSTTSNSIGRIEVCTNNIWGSICSDFFNDSDAMVVCRQLGYTSLGSISIGYINEYNLPFRIIDLNCTGHEATIQDCPSNGLDSYRCLSYHDAAVACHNTSVEYSNCTNNQLRLFGGSSEMKGRVEICHENVWFGLCSDGYNNYNNPATICESLGYSSQDASGYFDVFDGYPKLPLIPYEFRCYTIVDSLWKCRRNIISCSSGIYRYAGVTCQAKCKDDDVRLFAHTYSNIGQVDLCINGVWSSVCWNSFDDADAKVVCAHLGYTPHGAIPTSPSSYRRPIYIRDLNCSGNEINIWNCSHTVPSTGYCYSAVVICQITNSTIDTTCADGDVRLVGGTSELEGSVEMCYNTFWGSVCHTYWSTSDANVVCKQLGHQPTGSTALTGSYFGHSPAPYIINRLQCSTDASSLLKCRHRTLSAVTNCGDANVAGVVCLDSCDDGDVRLSGSSIKFAGRVEICIEGIWTSLCDQGWDLKDAQVVCRELGYSVYGAIPTYGCYTEGQLSFGITHINCTGTESNLLNCSHSNPVLYNCGSYNDAGLVCHEYTQRANCTNGEVRLVGGSGPHEGRVEICVNEAWGTVCSTGWNNADVNVVCRQLGYLPLGGRTSSFGQGIGPILMSNLYCSGSEISLLQCRQRSCGVTTCTHANDVGIICERPCTNGTIRLGDGAVLRGRVEVCVNGTWVTICTNHWTTQEARVSCSQLGYSPYGATAVSHAFNNGEWPIGIYELQCTGYENTLWDCQYNTSYNGQRCGRASSVFCMPNSTKYSNCTDGDIRLVGGQTENEGNVQVCHSMTWGSVCHSYWSTTDGNVVCRQLGFQPYGSSIYYNNHFSVSNNPPSVYGLFYCAGTEQSLLDCPRSSPNSLLYCSINKVAGVQCVGTCTDGKVRLRGSTNPTIGRVEICLNGTWATVCDEKWDDKDATVICHQLGHSPYGAIAAYGTLINSDSYPTRVYGVNCTGREETIFECPLHLTSQYVSYVHCAQNDAGVICQASQTLPGHCSIGEVRLRGGSTVNQGRVEICINNAWGTVCDDGWDVVDSNVVCKQLGYQAFGSKPKFWSSYGQSSLPIMLADLACTGAESTLLNCNRNSFGIIGCYRYELAGVECEELCTDNEVRIVGIQSPSSYGRVEVCVNQTWGTICDSTWNDAAASVVCKEQKFSPYGAIAAKNGFTNSLLPAYIDGVNCIGSEASIFECILSYRSDDSVCEAAGVICQDANVIHVDCTHGQLRLIREEHLQSTEGRVEICMNGVWGTICDDSWDTADANVVCDQLGYYPSGAKPRYGAFYGQGSGPIFLSNLHCKGSELNVLQCIRDMYSVRYCKHYEDVGVKCLGSFPVYSSRSVGNMLGGEIVVITGPSFKPDDSILCTFGQIETLGGYLSWTKCICVVPPAANDGIVNLNIKITRGTAILTGGTKFRYIMSESDQHVLNIESEDSYSVGTGDSINITWDESALTDGLLSEYTVTLNITMMLYNTDTDVWEKSVTLASGVPASDGRAEITIPDYPEIDQTSLRLSQIKASISTVTSSSSTQKRLIPLAILGGIAVRVIGRAVLKYAVKKIRQKIKAEIKEAARSAALRIACEVWHKHARGVNNRQLPPCPCRKSQANGDDRYSRENLVQDLWRKKVFKRNKATNGCYRQSNVGSYSPSQQCCYGSNGDILTGTDGGSAYSVYPNNWKSFLGHLAHDVVPHYLCCSGKYFSGCQSRYNNRRPNDNCDDYPRRPPPARTFGDPHLVTLDGYKYTFNGRGEFTLVQSLNGSLMVQVRMTEPIISTGNESNQTLTGRGTVITAIVAKHIESDTVQFEVVDGRLVTLVNGDEIHFDELSDQQFNNVTVSNKGNGTVSAALTTGVTITIRESNNILSSVAVTLSDVYYGDTIGLLGQYNGNKEDDLMPKNESITVPSNSSTEDIHYQFGLSWINTDPIDSLFTYGAIGSWNAFYKPDYRPIFQATFNDSTLQRKAQEICGTDSLCLFDVAATGDLTIGQDTKETGQELETITELLKPTVCNPPCVHGACVDNDTCSCAEGYEGILCNDTVYQECQEDFCLNDATCQIVAGDYLCICLQGFTGPDCGTVLASSSPSTSPTPTSDKSILSSQIITIIGSISVIVAVILSCAIVAIFTCICLTSQRKKKNSAHDAAVGILNDFDLQQEKYEMK